MSPRKISRRTFVKGSLSALALTSIPARFAFGQTTTRVRPEWQQFKSSANYSSFIDALRIMRANTNGNDRSSLRYWSNSHANFCPHEVAYFLAWHRGYLYYFEQQLRIVSGNSNLVLPYWDYYTNPNIPAEFTDPASNNPLYVSRVNTNVYSALSLRPFDSSVWNFERGRTNAFEPLIESRPHNPVHTIIGGVMATIAESPMDPIFYLHHCNIDRLWHAWAMPNGKGIPGPTSPYWSGSFSYAADLTLPRLQCYHPSRLGFDYANVTPPSSLPPQANNARLVRVQAQVGGNRPQVIDATLTPPRSIGAGRRSAGGARSLGLTESSITVSIPVAAEDRQSLQSVAASGRGGAGGGTTGQYKSAYVVLDNVNVLAPGRQGGYFYDVYLNLPPDATPSPSGPYWIGTLSTFNISAATHHGNSARISFPVTEALANIGATDLSALTVSLVRVNGQNYPRGRVIAVDELRVELSTDEPFDTSPHVGRGPNEPYR